MLVFTAFLFSSFTVPVQGSSFRLVDAYGNTITAGEEGLLLYNDGTVCDDSFSDNSAAAICKEMGFETKSAWSKGLKWSSLQYSYEIKLDNVHCPTPEWSSCTYKTIDDCGHSEDVFLQCKGALCPAGKFRSASSCKSCPDNSISERGSTSCQCKAGKYWNVNVCSTCPEGTASPEGVQKCNACPSGSKSIQDGSSCSCPDGWEWKWIDKTTGSCTQCIPGFYKSNQTTSCTICPIAATSFVGSDHCICRAGQFWNSSSSDCENCPEGHVSQEGSLECQRCPEGSQVDGSAENKESSCSCSNGLEWEWIDKASGTCKQCLPGTYRNNLTTTCRTCPVGARSLAGSDHCICQAGRFWNSSSCEICPEGHVSQCSGMSKMHTRITSCCGRLNKLHLPGGLIVGVG